MSRVGKLPIQIPDKVSVDVKHNTVTVKGPMGELSQTFHPESEINVKDKEVLVTRKNNTKFQRSLHGTVRSVIDNMVQGVSKGFQRDLEIVGVGYRAEAKGKMLQLNVGYSHSVYFVPPEGVDIAVNSQTSLTIKGINKQLVGHVASKIRSIRPPEPYKGKGIRYVDEYVKRKAGKTGAK